MTRRPKIVLLGMLSKIPVGGVAWLVGQYAVGFERLGFDVYYVEAHARTPSTLMEHDEDDSTGKATGVIADAMNHFGLDGRWAFHALHDDGRCHGMSEPELRRLYRDAALIINMHGGTVPLPEHAETGRLVYLGTDPVELELKLQRGDQQAIDFLEPHVAFFTWGLNYGNPDCMLPWSERFPFVPSPPPVVTDLWENDVDPVDGSFTTIGNWRQGWRDVHFRGEVYRWSKHHEFKKVLTLPRRVGRQFELALSSYVDADRRRLERHGWRVRPGFELSRDLDSYRDYIVGSRGEFTVAKDQNVRLRTGWFSERTATYLAAGRPVVVQDTGFGNAIPTGVGVLPFTSVEEAADAIEAVNGDYERHRRVAVDVARQYFNYDVVLGRMLDHVGLARPSRSTHRSNPTAPAVPVDLPRSLRLTPRSRRPLELPRETVERVLARPIPGAGGSPSHRPTASVVVVTFDNLVLTRMTIESVLANTPGPPYEIVVVDNGSTDGTRGYLSVVAARNPHLRLVRNKANRGFAAAANQGMTVARGDILVLLNNDTIVPPGWLSGLAAHLGDAAVGLVGPVTNRCGNEAEVKVDYETYGDLLEWVEQRRHVATERAFELPVAEMFCVALRRDVLERVGPLDERYEIGMFEDDDYSRRVRDAGLRVMCAEDVFVHHFGEASLGRLSASGRYAEVFETNRRRFEEKWSVRWEAHRRRPDPEYDAVRRRVRAAVGRLVPAGSVVLVISKGDDSLLDLPGLAARHFPRMADGQYAGHYPADDEDAITQLETERRRGAGYLVVPAPSMWWLDHYQGFARHLEHRHRQSAAAPETAVIFELDGSGAMVPGASHVTGGSR